MLFIEKFSFHFNLKRPFSTLVALSSFFNSKHTRCSTACISEREMRFLLRLINTRRITTTKNRISFLTSCTTKSNTSATSHPQSESQWDHSGSDPKPPSISEFGPNSLTCRLERLPRKDSVLVAFQGWMRDGFAVHRGLIFHVINRLRRRQMYSRALEVKFTLYKIYLKHLIFSCTPHLEFSLIFVMIGDGMGDQREALQGKGS